MPDLNAHSRRVILRHQQASGAYPACPTMPDYQYCWFRDGSFIAHAMQLYGEAESALAFHRWAARTVLRHETGARQAVAAFQGGRAPDPHDVLRARYTYDGGKGPDDWPEFQLDGLGTWLWALREFARGGAPLEDDLCRAAELVGDYLAIMWKSPCHDLWEESGDRVHTYTLAAIYGGLQAAVGLLERPALVDSAQDIQRFVLERCAAGGVFTKSVGVDLVDGSLAGLGTPYRLVEPGSPPMVATAQKIENDLHAAGFGVHRYLGDSYYGGGAWLLLSAWLGWHYLESGQADKARSLLAEVESQATPSGDMPEQVTPPMQVPAKHDYWVKVRGSVATPLLWSHAMYLILRWHVRLAGEY